ncbi:MAG TPA: hypothetical protein VEL75_03385 [Candidatus Methylomirabilis sp.]|nr:hypothetical protein [Candidatus Methylomirabilis sp.]
MEGAVVTRLASWLDRPEILAVDPERIGALARALRGGDPPVSVGRWGSVVGYDPAPGRRRLVQFDRRGNLIAALHWRRDGALGWARCFTGHGCWLGIEPRATTDAICGESDRLWLLDSGGGWAPREALTVFQSVDYERLDFIPVLAEPRRLPAGAGTAVLDLLSGLMKDQGTTRVRYRGPYPTEQLFTALLESFHCDPAASDPLGRFMHGDPLEWLPAPHERHHVAADVAVQLRHQVEKVVYGGAAFYRPAWQGVLRSETRIVRPDRGRTVCSLWALGRSIEDRLVLDDTGEVIEAPAPAVDRRPDSPLPPVWRPALSELIARESAPALGPFVEDALGGVALAWGAVAGDLLAVDGPTLRLSRRLRDAAAHWLQEAPPGAERAQRATRVVLEVARLVAPVARRRAQMLLEALGEEEQRRALLESDGEPRPLSESVGRLVALIASGRF